MFDLGRLRWLSSRNSLGTSRLLILRWPWLERLDLSEAEERAESGGSCCAGEVRLVRRLALIMRGMARGLLLLRWDSEPGDLKSSSVRCRCKHELEFRLSLL